VLNHVIHANAIATSGVWRIAQLSSTEVGVTSFWVLNFMWLKFLVIWRFFRSWALLDGVETPENISRCVNNTTTGVSGRANLWLFSPRQTGKQLPCSTTTHWKKLAFEHAICQTRNKPFCSRAGLFSRGTSYDRTCEVF
jgi:hypothetical protein